MNPLPPYAADQPGLILPSQKGEPPSNQNPLSQKIALNYQANAYSFNPMFYENTDMGQRNYVPHSSQPFNLTINDDIPDDEPLPPPTVKFSDEDSKVNTQGQASLISSPSSGPDSIEKIEKDINGYTTYKVIHITLKEAIDRLKVLKCSNFSITYMMERDAMGQHLFGRMKNERGYEVLKIKTTFIIHALNSRQESIEVKLLTHLYADGALTEPQFYHLNVIPNLERLATLTIIIPLLIVGQNPGMIVPVNQAEIDILQANDLDGNQINKYLGKKKIEVITPEVPVEYCCTIL